MNHRLLLIDGNALVHRAFHAIPLLTASNGTPTNAVYGFSTILMRVINELKPEYIAVTFDKKGPTFRHEEFDGYKAKRVKAPDELYNQIPKIKEVITAFDIPIFEAEGFEADDVIGTITSISQKTDSSLEIFIVTGDMDALQLVNENVLVYTARKGISDIVLFDKNEVIKKYGLTPSQMIDYKTMRGDPSDNIPGIPGIGEKTASQLLQKYHNIDEIIKNLDQLPKGIKTKIENGIPTLDLSRRLVTIVRDVPLEYDLNNCKFGNFNRQKVEEIFKSLQFKSLLSKIPQYNKENIQTKEVSKTEPEQLRLV